MKTEDRGRAKYRPMKDYDANEVKALLLDKISIEQEAAQRLDNFNENQNLYCTITKTQLDKFILWLWRFRPRV